MRFVRLILVFTLTSVSHNAQTGRDSALYPIEEKGKHGYTDNNKTGHLMIEPRFADTNPFSDSVAVVRVPGQSELPHKEGLPG